MAYSANRKKTSNAVQRRGSRAHFAGGRADINAFLLIQKKRARSRVSTLLKLMRLAKRASSHPETWIDTSAMSDAEFLAMHVKDKQGS